ncbi:hypothetical protein N781_05775 [Pontibacillus halophilus JSM 076056 = DSM 19796]|uniref:Competence protein ComGE n=1 Tax=Pontibacillus halophilus JSM 076056 = DSM 19796 TaxID=1385510 RepID=A0A0A5I558_9BACI|nr:hypothetical protein [Pontibacillus halophilus]KGX90957.1 hypothetical protein N781_05775 [Pontibacillus halophilus JSM 076056 = DSM 19796]
MYFRSAHPDFTSNREHGFSFVESMLSLNIFLIVTSSLLPVAVTLHKEMEALHIETEVLHQLEGELYRQATSSSPSATYTKKVNEHPITFTIALEEQYVRGCATWTTFRTSKEECLYVKQE